MDTQDTVDTQTAEQTATGALAASETSTPETTEEAASTENAETPAQETEQSKPEGEESSTEEDKPRKLSRSERMRRRMQAMATELETLRAQFTKPEAANSETDAAPKEADFNGDYFAYQTAKAAHDAAQAVAKQFAERDAKEAQTRLAQRQAEANEEFLERVEEVKANIADYDKVINDFAKAGGRFAPHVIEELRDSEKGPVLAYELAKNPALSAELNALSPRDAAREIGRIEARLSLPKPKTTTKAPPPIAPVSGGGSPNTQEADLNAWLKRTYGKGA